MGPSPKSRSGSRRQDQKPEDQSPQRRAQLAQAQVSISTPEAQVSVSIPQRTVQGSKASVSVPTQAQSVSPQHPVAPATQQQDKRADSSPLQPQKGGSSTTSSAPLPSLSESKASHSRGSQPRLCNFYEALTLTEDEEKERSSPRGQQSTFTHALLYSKSFPSPFKYNGQPLSRHLIISIAGLLDAYDIPAVLWGSQMLMVHGVPSLTEVRFCSCPAKNGSS